MNLMASKIAQLLRCTASLISRSTQKYTSLPGICDTLYLSSFRSHRRWFGKNSTTALCCISHHSEYPNTPRSSGFVVPCFELFSKPSAMISKITQLLRCSIFEVALLQLHIETPYIWVLFEAIEGWGRFEIFLSSFSNSSGLRWNFYDTTNSFIKEYLQRGCYTKVSKLYTTPHRVGSAHQIVSFYST